jgi:chromosome segregation ATPase
MSEAIAGLMPRCRFAFTRRQWRDQAKRLEAIREEEAAVAQSREANLREEIAGSRRENAALRARLAHADELVATQQQQIRRDHVDLGVLRKERDAARAMSRQLAADLTATRAGLENATRVTVPPMHRDTDGLDQPTVPTPVITLQQAHGGAL